MNPLLLIVPGIYNVFYAVAIAAAAAIIWQAGIGNGWKRGRWAIVLVAWVAAGVVGALLPHALLGDLAATRTCIGAVAAATMALTLAARSAGISAARALDATAAAIPIGGAIVRIGCFVAGCCEGTVTTLFTGIANRAGESARHPVQLYEATLEAALAFAITRPS